METKWNTHGRKPSFIQILFKDFSQKLSIPPHYVRLYGHTLAKTCILQPVHKHRSWPVSTEQFGDHLYFRKDGKCLHKSVLYNLVIFYVSNMLEILSFMWKSIIQLVVLSKMLPLTMARLLGTLLTYSQHVPSDFANMHWEGSTRVVKIESSGKTWIVKLKARDDGYGWKSISGWIGLVREKPLKLGDVCVFELINSRDDVLKLSVIGKNSALEEKKRKFNQLKTKSTSSRWFTRENQEQLNMALTLKSRSKNPSYFISMMPAYIKNYYLFVKPTFLSEMQLKDGAHKLKLLYLGKEWDVNLKIAGAHGRINKGWHTFVKDNSLQKRDVCFFELINKQDVVIEVSILKCTSTQV